MVQLSMSLFIKFSLVMFIVSPCQCPPSQMVSSCPCPIIVSQFAFTARAKGVLQKPKKNNGYIKTYKKIKKEMKKEKEVPRPGETKPVHVCCRGTDRPTGHTASNGKNPRWYYECHKRHNPNRTATKRQNTHNAKQPNLEKTKRNGLPGKPESTQE